MRICLVNPSIIRESALGSPLSTRNKYFLNPYNLPHIGLGYITATLNENGFEADIIECARLGINEKQVCEMVSEGKYDIIGISVYYFNYMSVMRIVNKIKADNPSTFIFLGGFLPTMSYDLVLNSIDTVECCVVGEGEITTLELVKKLELRENWKDTRGIAYKENDKITFTGKRDLVDNLDILPFPVRPFISERKIVSVLTTRGCYGYCTYCGIQEFFNTCNGKKVRRRSPENVVEEIEALVKEHDIKFVTFNDGNFHIASKVGEEWFNRFYKQIKEKNIKIKYLVDFRANEIVKGKHIIEKFVEIGLHNVNVGIESYLESQLEFYKKQVKVEDNIKAVRILEELKIKYTYGILIFDPIITISEVLNFLKQVKEVDLYKDEYNIRPPLTIASTVVATTGTPIYDYVVKNGLYAQNELNYKFIDEKTNLCHEVIKKWRKKVIPLYNKNYISFIADENNMNAEYEGVKKLYQALFYIDLEFFINVCNEIIEGNHDIEMLDSLITKWEEKLAPISEKLSELENELLKYYHVNLVK